LAGVSIRLYIGQNPKILRKIVFDALKLGGAKVVAKIGTPQVHGLSTIFSEHFQN
jgi:hypothetical protein